MASEDGTLIIGGPRDGTLWFGTLHHVLQTRITPPPDVVLRDFDKKAEPTMTSSEIFQYRLATYRDHKGGDTIRVYVPHDMADVNITAAVLKSYHARALKETREQAAKVPR